MSRIICFSLVFLLVVLVSGCGSKLNINPKFTFAPYPQTVKGSLNVGVYYSPQFAEQEYIRTSEHGYRSVYVAPIGSASVWLFDDILRRVFEKRISITRLSKDEVNAKGVDMVIAPSIEFFNFRLGGDIDSDWYSVCYRVTLYTKQVMPGESWVICGNAKTNQWGIITSWVADDLTDAATKIQKKLEDNLDTTISGIVNKTAASSAALDRADITLDANQIEPSGFDEKQLGTLQQAGVVAVQVKVRSNAAHQLVARASDMRLVLKDDLVIEPLSVGSLLSVLGVVSGAGSVSPSLITGGGGDPLLAPIVAFNLIPLLITMNELAHESRLEWGAREKEFNTSDRALFLERNLIKGKGEAGIVFFRLPDGVKTTEGATLTVWVVNPVEADGVHIGAMLTKAK